MPDHSAVPSSYSHKPAVALGEHDTLKGSQTVTMIFPHDVTMLLQDYSKVHFKAGAQEVPVELKDHWYLRNNGVLPYEPRAAEVEPKEVLLDKEPEEQSDPEPEEATQPRKRKGR